MIVGYTGYRKTVEVDPIPKVKYSEHKLRGYAGFEPQGPKDDRVIANIKPHTQTQGNNHISGVIPGYGGFMADTRDR